MIKIKKFIGLLGLALFLSSCSGPNEEPKITYTVGSTSSLTQSEDQLNEDFKITTDKSIYTLSDNISYTVINNSDIDYYVISNEISIEKKVNNTWKKVIFNILPNKAAGQEIIKLSKENTFDAETRPLNEWLTEGTYRIVHIISKDSQMATEDIILISPEFTIK